MGSWNWARGRLEGRSPAHGPPGGPKGRDQTEGAPPEDVAACLGMRGTQAMIEPRLALAAEVVAGLMLVIQAELANHAIQIVGE
jgi:hypothetical protein